MNKRFIVVVLDSFGVGAMADCKKVRSQDINANTALHLIERENLFLPTLQKLGIMNAIGKETPLMKFEKNANFAVSNLMHFGADTFFGHQEIMGTKPSAPTMQPFSLRIDDVEA
ncbi:MAG: phosphopentomutase, partial [Clostridia bacterium]